jgi:RNA-binding protein
MRRVGTVSGAANGVVVVRCDGDPPEVGTDVVDESLDAVGRVVDVFGPVEAPYVAVSPRDGVAPATLLGGRLYAR